MRKYEDPFLDKAIILLKCCLLLLFCLILRILTDSWFKSSLIVISVLIISLGIQYRITCKKNERAKKIKRQKWEKERRIEEQKAEKERKIKQQQVEKELDKQQLRYNQAVLRCYSDIRMIDQLNGYEFEEFVARLCQSLGFEEVTVTSKTGDQGIDVLLQDKDGEQYGIQCKRFKSKVGNTAVQEAIAGKFYYDLSDVAVISNNYYTQSAIDLAEKADVQLVNREDLLMLIDQAKHKTSHKKKPRKKHKKKYKKKHKSKVKKKR